MRASSISLLVSLAACGGFSASTPDDAGSTDAAPDAASGCPAGKAGAACVLALYDRAIAACDGEVVAELRRELEARATLGPLWADGRALFRTDLPVAIAGEHNGWSQTALVSAPVCNSDLVVAVGAVPSGHWPYKLARGDTWSLDPRNPAFAYDDFGGNPDGKNSVIATPDAPRGVLVQLARACSTALGNCRDVTAYLPPGYDAPANAERTYPVMFMHDGQNVWDDHDCCFGHTGWEVNVALDAELAAGRIAPVIVIAAAHSPDRNNEYGLSATKLAAFLEFQVTELQPQALAQVRWDGERVTVAGSSLGGLVSMHLALRYPQTYAAAASLSGAFWPGMDTGTALRDRVPSFGKQPVALYLDHGGDPATNADGAADTIEVRDLLLGLGWSASCAIGADALCYRAAPGAAHDELAWKARTPALLRYLFPR